MTKLQMIIIKFTAVHDPTSKQLFQNDILAFQSLFQTTKNDESLFIFPNIATTVKILLYIIKSCLLPPEEVVNFNICIFLCMVCFVI